VTAGTIRKFQDKNGKWLGGAYPTGIKGTHDWQRIEVITRLPESAATCHLACYVRQGMTGTAWFDDIELVRCADPPMPSMVLLPVYRGRITAQGPEAIHAQARLNLIDFDLNVAQVRLHAQLRSLADAGLLWESLLPSSPERPDVIDLVQCPGILTMIPASGSPSRNTFPSAYSQPQLV
jgi:hypothetical protein